MLKRTLRIVLTTTLWIGIIAYIMVATHHARTSIDMVTVDSLAVSVADDNPLGAVNEQMLASWVARSGVEYKGRSMNEVDVAALRRSIENHPQVRQARVYVDMRGVLHVEVSQYHPVARIKSSNGYDFFLTSDGHLLPPHPGFAAHVPVVTGECPFMMPTGYYGDYEQIKQRLIDEYKADMGELDSVRHTYATSLAELQAERAEWRSRYDKKWWGKERKEMFRDTKQKRLAELAAKITAVEERIAAIDQKRTLLTENQKKSAKKYLYLYKLLNFVNFVEGDPFWRSQIVQINVTTPKGYSTPQIEIVPRAGQHVVCLGDVERAEAQLEKLLLFYREALAWEGWDGYRYIDLRYEDQIVCTK